MTWFNRSRPAGSTSSDADLASLDARRQSRKRVAVTALSAAVLVAIVVAAVAISSRRSSSDSSDTKSASDASPISTSIKAVCDTTLYPSTCLKTLSPVVNSSSIDPATLFQLSIQVAMDGLSAAGKRLDELGAKGPAEKMYAAAWRDCQSLLHLAITQLNDTLSRPDITSEEAVDDLKTWLSSAITYQQTCVDGFENATEALRVLISGSVENSTEMASNSLSILTSISEVLESIRFRRRRLMAHSSSHPRWVEPRLRKLLQESSDSGSFEADIVVAQDGTGDFELITDAVTAVPDQCNRTTVIYVKSGTYYENIWVDKDKWNIMMVGDGMDSTVVSGNLNFVDGVPTFSTATFGVIGKGFMAKDMAFVNTAGAAKQQAVALVSLSDQSVFYRCRFDAYQDTLYANANRQYYRDCIIYGTVDFIFGNAASVFDGCTILPRMPLPGQQDTITAQGKTDPHQTTGIVIRNCTVVPAGNLTSVQVYLGRPWKNYSTTVFVRSMLDGLITPAGWLPWNGTGTGVPDTIFYGEYQNCGPGAATAGRVTWKGVRSEMSKKEAGKFTVKSFIGGEQWLPVTGVPYNLGL